jgi:predicted transcriptional regulator
MEEAMLLIKKDRFLVGNRRNVYVATDIHRKLKELAAKRDSKLQELVQDALVQYLDRQENHR